LDATLWLRRWALWSSTCPAVGSGLSLTHCQSSLPSLFVYWYFGIEISSLPLPHSVVQLQCSTTPSAVHVWLQFTVFQFCCGGSTGAVLVYVPRGWVGEFRVVHGAHLFVLSVEAQEGLELAVVVARIGTRFSQCNVGRLSTGWGLRMLKVWFWLMLYVCLIKEGEEKERKKKTIAWGRSVSPGLDLPCCLCCSSQLLGAIKGWFEGQSLNFSCT
jgi:hypothetical protein